jgi:hypothetical protein
MSLTSRILRDEFQSLLGADDRFELAYFVSGPMMVRGLLRRAYQRPRCSHPLGRNG